MEKKFLKIKVKSLFEDRVAIRDKYVAEAKTMGLGLCIVHAKRMMFIRPDNIKEQIKATSQEVFEDKYSGKFHHLVYFEWKPNDGEQLEIPFKPKAL